MPFTRLNASFHSVTKRIVFDNGVSGFELCQLEDLRSITSLTTSPAVTQKPRQVVFANGGALVVGGSDAGYARVFDTEGKVLQDLVLPEKSLHHIISVSGLGFMYNPKFKLSLLSRVPEINAPP